MTPKVDFHSNNIKEPLSVKIENYFKTSEKIDIAVGFLSKHGLETVNKFVAHNSKSIKKVRIVCGAITGYGAFKSLGKISSQIKVKIYFLYTYKSKNRDKIKYLPMMHSKSYLFKKGDDRIGIIGSSNLSHFALDGKNVEASTIIEDKDKNPFFKKQQEHFDTIWTDSKNISSKFVKYYHYLGKFILGTPSLPEFLIDWHRDENYIPAISIIDLEVTKLVRKKLKKGERILFESSPFKKFRQNEHHLIHYGKGKLLVVEVYKEKYSDSGTSGTQDDHNFEIIEKPPGKMEIVSGKAKKISSSTSYVVFNIKEISNISTILSKPPANLKNIYGTEKWLAESLVLSKEDIIDVDVAKINEKEGKDTIQAKRVVEFKLSEKEMILFEKLELLSCGGRLEKGFFRFIDDDEIEHNEKKYFAKDDKLNPRIFLDNRD